MPDVKPPTAPDKALNWDSEAPTAQRSQDVSGVESDMASEAAGWALSVPLDGEMSADCDCETWGSDSATPYSDCDAADG